MNTKQLMERFLSGVGLAVLTPILLLASILLLILQGRPLLYTQSRVGRNGKKFQLLKFRSMRTTSEGAAITAAGDCRITTAGRFLRKYKIDELPQLWNVLRGDMSFIGPRPEAVRYVDSTDPLWQAVLEARPGITDLATLVYRDEEAILAASANPEEHYRTVVLPRKLALNLRYMSSRSLYSDMKLLTLTIRYSFWPRGFDANKIRREFHVQETV